MLDVKFGKKFWQKAAEQIYEAQIKPIEKHLWWG